MPDLEAVRAEFEAADERGRAETARDGELDTALGDEASCVGLGGDVVLEPDRDWAELGLDRRPQTRSKVASERRAENGLVHRARAHAFVLSAGAEPAPWLSQRSRTTTPEHLRCRLVRARRADPTYGLTIRTAHGYAAESLFRYRP